MSWTDCLIALLLSFAGDELLGWSRTLANWMARCAARRLPPELRERMEEEWLEAMSTRPRLSQLFFALDLFRAAYIIEHEVRLPSVSPVSSIAVRVLDILTGVVLILFAGPMMFLIVVAMKFERGVGAPVFARSTRIGLLGRPIHVMKFSTLIDDINGIRRVSNLGRMVRILSLDELPMLFNVVRGEMSLVGPRPDRPSVFEKRILIVPEYANRLKVRPGIIGPSQFNVPVLNERESILGVLKADKELIAQYGLRSALRWLGRAVVAIFF